MKNLEFCLQNNGETLIKKICAYDTIGDEIIVYYGDLIIKVLDNGEKKSFIRESKDDKMVLTNDAGTLNAVVTLLDINYSAHVKLLNFDIKHMNKSIVINYTIESDIDNEKTIVLNLAI